uniref:Cytochrome P450 82A3 isoform X2 n=2 Tax=Nicotiana TaxID=4085 RepID=A0A1S4BN43_TOBAC|nr:PREDICTED: cytochrome P450 82A3-like isoform X2 [Nicotiana tabacum]
MDFVLIAITLASSLVFLFLIYNQFLSTKRNNGQRKRVPEAAGAWPIIGHLHLLSGSESDQLPHKVLARMAEKYGPIFGLKLGVYKAVVVSDPKIAKECFTTNDLALANRPKSLASEIIGYNHAMFGVAPYGPYWREIRKIATIEFLSTRRIEVLKHIREFEVKSAIKESYEFWLKNKSSSLNGAVKMEMKEWLGNVIMNTMVKMLFGKECTEGEGINKAHKAIRRFFELMGATVVADFLPYLRWLDIGGHEKAMKEVAKEIDSVVEEWLGEHKRRRDSKGIKSGEEEDFMDVMLSICENRDLPGFDADTSIKATCMALLAAGTDTTIVTLT